MSSPFAKINDRRAEARPESDDMSPMRRMSDHEMQVRIDGWFSALGGHGTARDKRSSGQFVPDFLDEITIGNLWSSDDIAARIIEAPVDEALRTGYRLNVGDKTLADDLIGCHEELKVDQNLRQAGKIDRAHGGAAIFPIINDGQKDLSQPLIMDRISRIEHLQVFEPREMKPLTWYNDLRRPKYRRPKTFLMFPRSPGGFSDLSGQVVHESRFILFNGIQTTETDAPMNGFGWSQLNRVWHVLRDFNMGWGSAMALLHDFSQAAFKIKGLAGLIAQDRDDVIRTRIQMVDLARSTIRAVLMDSEEEFERKATPTSGLAELLHEALARVAAAADMPITRLFGTSPGGLGSNGEQETTTWYDRVDMYRTLRIHPQLTQLVRLQMRSRTGPCRGVEPKRWKLAFNPLKQLSKTEEAAYRASVANTDNVYFAMGAVSPEEIAFSRWGGDEYSGEMNINFEQRRVLGELGDTVVDPPPKPVAAEQTEETPPEEAPPAPGLPGAPPVPPPPSTPPELTSQKTEDSTDETLTGESDESGEVPTEAVVQEVDEDGDPETPPVEYVTIKVKGHARKIRLRRKRTDSAISEEEIRDAVISEIGARRSGMQKTALGSSLDRLFGLVETLRRLDGEDQPRDELGRFGEGSGGGKAEKFTHPATKGPHLAKLEAYRETMKFQRAVATGKAEGSSQELYHKLEAMREELRSEGHEWFQEDEYGEATSNKSSEFGRRENGEMTSAADDARVDKALFVGDLSGFDPTEKLASSHLETSKPGDPLHPKEFKAFSKYYNGSLTDDQRAVCQYYSHRGDRIMNNSLRGDIPMSGELRARVEKLDEAISRATLTQDVTTYRGVGGDFGRQLQNAKIGDSFVDKGYVSTAAQKEYAQRFVDKAPSNGTMLHVRIPAGRSAAPVPSNYAEESEMLIGRGSSFRITKIDGNNVHVEME